MQVLKPPQPKANLMLIDTSAKNAIEGLIGVFVVLVTLDSKKKKLLFWKMVLCLEDFCFCYLLIDFRMEKFEILHV